MGNNKIRIGLWGGPGSGKTTFLAAMYLAGFTATSKWKVAGLDSTSIEFLKTTGLALIRGEYPKPSGAPVQLRFQISAVNKKRFGSNLDFEMFVDDRPGEDFILESPDDPMWAELADCNGLVYLFDPQLDQQQALGFGQFSGYNPTESGNFGYLAYSAQCIQAKKRQQTALENGRLPQHLAVCLTKFDEPDIVGALGKAGLTDSDPDPVTGAYPAHPNVSEAQSRQAIVQFADENSLAVIDRHFHRNRAQYFVSSSVGFGGDPDSPVKPASHPTPPQPVRPINVLEPLVWVQRQVKKSKKKGPLSLLKG